MLKFWLKIKYLFIKPYKNIPYGDYCYQIIKRDPKTGVAQSWVCPYYKQYKKIIWCALLNYGDDILLDDMCKICDLNLPCEEEKEYFNETTRT